VIIAWGFGLFPRLVRPLILGALGQGRRCFLRSLQIELPIIKQGELNLPADLRSIRPIEQ